MRGLQAEPAQRAQQPEKKYATEVAPRWAYCLGYGIDYSSPAGPGAGEGRARCPQRAAHVFERPGRRAGTDAPYRTGVWSIPSPRR